LGALWVTLGLLWEPFGQLLGHFRPPLAPFGSLWSPFGSIWAPFSSIWTLLDSIWDNLPTNLFLRGSLRVFFSDIWLSLSISLPVSANKEREWSYVCLYVCMYACMYVNSCTCALVARPLKRTGRVCFPCACMYVCVKMRGC